MVTLWSMPSSGNSYKIRLVMAHLGISYRHISAEMGSGVTASPAFRALNPDGKVPLLELGDGRTLRESNAILLYLARGTPLLPDDAYTQALCHQWMFFEQYSHEPAIAVRAGILKYEERAHLRTRDVLQPLLDKGHAALATMERQLAHTPFLIGNDFTVADICLYAYTHSAGRDGGFDMKRFPAINAWISAIAAMDAHIAIQELPLS